VRLVEFGALRMAHPLVSARIAAVLHPIGAAISYCSGPARSSPLRCCMAQAMGS
jgi:hypothetical protein